MGDHTPNGQFAFVADYIGDSSPVNERSNAAQIKNRILVNIPAF